MVEIGAFRLSHELVERHLLSRAGYNKIPMQVAYPMAWVVSRNEGGRWRPVRYFEKEEEAREWAEAGGPDEPET